MYCASFYLGIYINVGLRKRIYEEILIDNELDTSVDWGSFYSVCPLKGFIWFVPPLKETSPMADQSQHTLDEPSDPRSQDLCIPSKFNVIFCTT